MWAVDWLDGTQDDTQIDASRQTQKCNHIVWGFNFCFCLDHTVGVVVKLNNKRAMSSSTTYKITFSFW